MAKRKKTLDLASILKLEVPILGTVTLCEGEDWEYEAPIYRPSGSKWLVLYPKLGKYMVSLMRNLFPNEADSILEGNEDVQAKLEEQNVNVEELFDAMIENFGDDMFRDELVPNVFGFDEYTETGESGMSQIAEYFDRYVGPNEFVPAFISASMMIISYNQSRPEVAEAQKKSSAEANGAEPDQ